MNTPEPGILDPVPPVARYLAFSLRDSRHLSPCLQALPSLVDGIGQHLASALDTSIPGLEPFPSYDGDGFAVPSTPMALWCWMRGEDRGALFHRSRQLIQALAPALSLESAADAFVHAGGRDLTGYEDGTENPEGEAAVVAALVRGRRKGMNASSYVAVQQWVHDLDRFWGHVPA